MTQEIEDPVQQGWETGTYSKFAAQYLPMAGKLVEATGVGSRDHVLDIGCGTGNVAITAARQGATVAGVDITPSMLEQARANADIAETDEIEWREGDAVDLPFEESAFDVTLSALGHMYAEPPDVAARELLRVTRPGGQIGFTSWTPTSLLPIMAGHVLTYLPKTAQPEFSEPPFMWGDRDAVTRRLEEGTEHLSFETKTVMYRVLSPAHFWQDLAEHSGMFSAFLEKIEQRASLREDIIDTIEPYFEPSENAVELEYLLTTATVPESQ